MMAEVLVLSGPQFPFLHMPGPKVTIERAVTTVRLQGQLSVPSESKDGRRTTGRPEGPGGLRQNGRSELAAEVTGWVGKSPAWSTLQHGLPAPDQKRGL